MSIGTSHGAITRYERVAPPDEPGAADPAPAHPKTALFRLRSPQPSRRAVLHLQAAGDPVVPADLAGWFTERACHFYLAGLRLPARLGWPSRPGRPRPPLRSRRATERAFAELDAVRAYLREADGIEHVIVSAQGRAAALAAQWCGSTDGGRADAGRPTAPPLFPADALILYRPAWPPGFRPRLDIACPVLVLSAGRGWRPRWRTGPRQLGAHVTWLRLPDGEPSGLAAVADSAGRRAFLDELGRWLGAYMYGQPADQLLAGIGQGPARRGGQLTTLTSTDG